MTNQEIPRDESVARQQIAQLPAHEGDSLNGESLHPNPVTFIDVRRHSEYDGGFPDGGWGKASDDEKAKLGHLTEEGVTNAHRVARELIDKRLGEFGSDIDFLVLASPTHWLGDEALGQRAIETAKIYSDEISEVLEERGLSPDSLLNRGHRSSAQHEEGDVRVSNKVVEAQIFDDPKFIPVIDELRAKYGGQGTEFWDAWYASADSELLDPLGAERSTEAADRADKQIEALVRYGEMYQRKTGRSLEVILITHHEVLQPYALHKLGVSQQEFVPGKNEGFVIKVEDGKSVVEIAGQEIERAPRTVKSVGKVALS